MEPLMKSTLPEKASQEETSFQQNSLWSTAKPAETFLGRIVGGRMSLREQIETALEEKNLDSAKLDELRRLASALGRPGFLTELKTVYVESNGPMIETLEDSFESMNVPEMIRMLHSMKSSCANMGLPRLYALCSAGETHLRSGDVEKEELGILIGHILREYQESLPQLPES